MGRTAGLYLLFARGEIIYVGHSSDLAARLARHRAEGTKGHDSARWYPLEDECQRLRWEGILILGLRPRENRGLNLGLSPDRIWEIRYPGAKRSSRPTRRGAG